MGLSRSERNKINSLFRGEYQRIISQGNELINGELRGENFIGYIGKCVGEVQPRITFIHRSLRESMLIQGCKVLKLIDRSNPIELNRVELIQEKHRQITNDLN